MSTTALLDPPAAAPALDPAHARPRSRPAGSVAVPVAIRGTGIVSPLGIGFDAFRHAVQDGGRARTETAAAPGMPACGGNLLAFDAATLLGGKGLAALNRMSQIAIVACSEALAGGTEDPARTGVVLGTAGGSFKSIVDFVRSTYTGDAPHLVSPLKFPNTVMNCAAAQCAIWLGLSGVNSTVCAGELSGLAALRYAMRMIRMGHADLLVAGGIEEYCDYTAWSHAALATDDLPMGEGAALFALGGDESSAGAQLLEIGLARASRRYPDVAARTIRGVLAGAGVDADALAWISAEPDAIDAATARACGIDPQVPRIAEGIRAAIGNTHAARAGFQLASALAMAPEGIGLVALSAPGGGFGCALVEIASTPSASETDR